MHALNALDYVLLVLYLAGTLALGLWIGRRLQTGRDYFLAGRRLPWWAIGMSLVATDIGGTDIIGVGGAAYTHGLAVANFEWIGCVPAMIVGAFLFIPIFWKMGICTIPEFMERRFNAGVRSALALCWLAFMACNLGIMLLASAKMLTVLFVGPAATLQTEVVCIIGTAALVGVYTVMGGLAAVVYTDMIQCAVMVLGCLLVLVLGMIEVGGPTQLRERLAALPAADDGADDDAAADGPTAPDDAEDRDAQKDDGKVTRYTSLVLPADSPSPFPWPAILFGLAFILSPAYWIGNQAIVQRSLGARSAFQAQAAYVWGAILKNVIPFIIAVPGLIALVQFPDLEEGDRAFPQLVATVLPMGLRGVFLAAFVAALMSSIDSYLNSASAILTNDFYQRFFRPQATDRQLLTVGRRTTIALVLWAVGFALWLTTLEGSGIYVVFQTLMAFFQGPALALLLTGLLWRRATGVAALTGFCTGVLTAVFLFVMSDRGLTDSLNVRPYFQIPEPFLYFSVWAFLVSLTVIVVLSVVTKAEPAHKLAYVVQWGRRTAADKGDT